MATPRYKIMVRRHETGTLDYIAACRYAEDAAAVCAMHDDAIVKVNGRIVFRDGDNDVHAADSYDEAARVMHMNERAHAEERRARAQTGETLTYRQARAHAERSEHAEDAQNVTHERSEAQSVEHETWRVLARQALL